MIKGRGTNPADAFRKQEKKKDAKKAKQQRDELREVRGMLNDPTKIDAEIEKVQKLSNENRLDKGLKDKIAELKRMRDVAVGKQKVDAALGRKPLPIVSSSSSSTTIANIVGTTRVFQPRDSVYYHPVYNPFANPPSGQPQMWKKDVPPPPPPSGARMQPMPMGGMHGIPLPPPRGLPPPPPIEAPISAPTRVNKRRILEVTFDDPLDPAASGYESQFGRKLKRAPEQPAADDEYQHHMPANQQQILDRPTNSLVIQEQAIYEEEEVGPSLPAGMPYPPLLGFSSIDNDNEIPHNKSNKKNKEKLQEPRVMLPGLEDYGDEEEEEGDDEEEPGEDNEDEEQDIGPSMPMDYNEYAAAFYQSDTLPPLTEMPDPTVETPVEVAPPVVKEVKVDQALTAFVPAVLKNKKTPKAPAFIPRPPASIPLPPAAVAAIKPKAAVDDDYDLFMQEISGL